MPELENPPVISKTTTQDPNSETPRKLKGAYVPKAEKAEHRAYYAFYERLGKNRSLPKVAKEFGKSLPFISTLSRAFRWQERIHQNEKEIKDPVVIGTRDKVDSSRTKLVTVVHDVTDTLYELSKLSRKIKDSNEGILSSEDTKRTETLLVALRVFGIEITKPKDLRDLISVLKDIVDFQGSVPEGSPKIEIGNVEKLLLIKDLD
jgi:hypothetical protein